MSICPTCGHWVAEPVPEGLVESIKPCRACAVLGRSGDVELEESVGKYTVACRSCGLSTGYYCRPGDAVEDWNALWGGEGAQEGIQGLGEALGHTHQGGGGEGHRERI